MQNSPRSRRNEMSEPQVDKYSLAIAKVEQRIKGPGEHPGFKNQDYCHVCGNNVRLGCLRDCAWAQIKEALVAPSAEREGFYEKLWKDVCSLQRGDAVGVFEKVERYYREQESRSSKLN